MGRREDHVRSLFGDRVTGPEARRHLLTVDRFDQPEAFRDYFKAHYGPTIAIYRAISDDPDRVPALDYDLVELARRFNHGGRKTVLDWEYLLVTAIKRH